MNSTTATPGTSRVRLSTDEREALCIGGDCDYHGYKTHTRDCQEHLAKVQDLLAARTTTPQRPPLTALDFVQMYLAQTELQPGQGHYVESRACRMKRPSGLPKDSDYRCTRCDGEALLATAGISWGENRA